MSVKDQAARIGTRAMYSVGELVIEVEILDIRSNFGRTDVLVRPVSGTGQAWVSDDKVRAL